MKKYLLIIFLCMQIVSSAKECLEENKLKILVGSVVYQKPEILKEFLESLKKLDKDSFLLDYFFADANNIEESKQLLKDFKVDKNANSLIVPSKINDFIESLGEKKFDSTQVFIWKVAKIKDQMIQKAIVDNYDYLFLVDSNIVLHPQTIEQLIKTKKDIISNICWTRTDENRLLPQVWLCDENKLYKHRSLEKLTLQEINKRTNDFLNMLKEPGIYEVGGFETCILISEAALKKGISFKKLSNLSIEGENKHFCIRAAALGLSLFVDTRYPAYHVSRKSDLVGLENFKKSNTLSNQIIWPSSYSSYKEENINKSDLRYFAQSYWPGVYLEPCIQKYIDKKNVSSILEIGSRDLKDAIDLSEYFKCHVFAFECNPECLEICRINNEKSPNVTLIEKAAWDVSGMIDFFPIINEKGKVNDPGSSSCFKMTEKTLAKYSQKSIIVPAIRLDEWFQDNHFENIDLICMDTQGATLKILKGMGDFLKKTKYIITECETSPLYEGECLLPELVAFLKDLGFELIPTEKKYDYLFINKSVKKVLR